MERTKEAELDDTVLIEKQLKARLTQLIRKSTSGHIFCETNATGFTEKGVCASLRMIEIQFEHGISVQCFRHRWRSETLPSRL
jgi:hypothetical protein